MTGGHLSPEAIENPNKENTSDFITGKLLQYCEKI